MGQKDITQKNFEAYNDVFSDIVNGTLFDGREVIKPEALVDAMAKSQYKADDNVIHEQERDVAKYWTDKNCYIRLALLGVENQLAIDMDMPLRVIGYDGSSYRDEMNHDEIVIDEVTGRKHKIRHERYPVVTIVLYFGKTPWKKTLRLYDVLKISDELKPFVSDYKINLIDVPRLTGEQVEKFTSDFQIIADYFVQLNESNDYVPRDKTIRHADSFLKLMSVLTQDDKYVEMYTPSMLVSMLYYANGSTWLNEDNTINEDNIKEFEEMDETSGIKFHGIIREGSPAKTILEVAKEEDIDLIVIGSSGKSGFDRFIMGSVAEKVVNAAKCAVLVIH